MQFKIMKIYYDRKLKKWKGKCPFCEKLEFFPPPLSESDFIVNSGDYHDADCSYCGNPYNMEYLHYDFEVVYLSNFKNRIKDKTQNI